ncbi:MAG: hypothetical protein H6818_22645 [Phycisphaerales bacterium]|nr:hypothetical protein [Phycisphaerales bacterium]
MFKTAILSLLAIVSGVVIGAAPPKNELPARAPNIKDTIAVTALYTEDDPIPMPWPPGSVCFDFETVSAGQHSGFGGYCGAPLPPVGPIAPGPDDGICRASVAQPALCAVIRDVCAWEDLWGRHVSFIDPQPPAPDVDFDRYVVVAVIAPPRPNGCYSMAIDRITRHGDVRKVHVVEYVPCSDPNVACTQVITNAHHFIKVCKRFLPPEIPVCFENRYSPNDCVIVGLCPEPKYDE